MARDLTLADGESLTLDFNAHQRAPAAGLSLDNSLPIIRQHKDMGM